MSDAYFEKGLASWDMAAGALLVQEAGGLIGNFTGEFDSDFLDQRECLAANPRIYAQMVQLLGEFSKYKTL
jgi:myo-inositol-1(or 4)-monophosphatase